MRYSAGVPSYSAAPHVDVKDRYIITVLHNDNQQRDYLRFEACKVS